MLAAKPKTRVLVVDDSTFMRILIKSTLDRDPELEVIGVAVDGLDAVEKAVALKPDVITLDIEMPRLDGIGALRQIMARQPARVLMVSTLSTLGAKETFDALDAGALDYVPKNISDSADQQAAFKQELLRKVKAVARLPLKPARQQLAAARPAMTARRSHLPPTRFTCVAIGASTGGPVAVQEVLSRIPINYPHGIIVAIHMPKAFTGPYADRLNDKCSIAVREAVEGDLLKSGLVLVVPGGMHCALARTAAGLQVRLTPAAELPQFIYVPAVDHLFASAADATNGACLGVVLTGMGNDGLRGAQHLKQKGGLCLTQDQATSTIYGMPKACADAGLADAVLPLGEIGPEIAHATNR